MNANTCERKNCNKRYDIKDLQRTVGDRDWTNHYCSAYCYTKEVTGKINKQDNYIDFTNTVKTIANIELVKAVKGIFNMEESNFLGVPITEQGKLILLKEAARRWAEMFSL